MDVSKRILEIINLIEYESIADIGTDHCYLPITAISLGRVKTAIGIDINPGPLKTACDNVAAAGLSGFISLRLGSGFGPLMPGEVKCAIISGMGGLLIKEILQKESEKISGLKQLILSPQSDIWAARQACHDAGFEIYFEVFIKDMGKFYNIILARPGKDIPYSKEDYRHGRRKFFENSEVYKEFAHLEINRIDKIIQSLRKSCETDNVLFRLKQLLEDKAYYEGILSLKDDTGAGLNEMQ